MWSQSTNVTDRQTDGRTDRQTTCDRNTALCTKVHRAVKKWQVVTVDTYRVWEALYQTTAWRLRQLLPVEDRWRRWRRWLSSSHTEWLGCYGVASATSGPFDLAVHAPRQRNAQLVSLRSVHAWRTQRQPCRPPRTRPSVISLTGSGVRVSSHWVLSIHTTFVFCVSAS